MRDETCTDKEDDDRESDGPELEERRRQTEFIDVDGRDLSGDRNNSEEEDSDDGDREGSNDDESEGITTDQEEEYMKLLQDSKSVHVVV
jgi:hypothetical protein